MFDTNPAAVSTLVKDGAIGAKSLDDFIAELKAPRVVWLMVPAAVVDKTLHHLAARMRQDDIIVDEGNSHYIDIQCSSRRLSIEEGQLLDWSVPAVIPDGDWRNSRARSSP